MMRGLDEFDSCMQFHDDDPHLYAEERRPSIQTIIYAGFQAFVHALIGSNLAQLLEMLPLALAYSVILFKSIAKSRWRAANMASIAHRA
jgi:hypothetical protein